MGLLLVSRSMVLQWRCHGPRVIGHVRLFLGLILELSSRSLNIYGPQEIRHAILRYGEA